MSLFICYEKCSTCKKAKKYLDEKHIKYTIRDIKGENPSYQEIKDWIEKYDLDIKKLFNTSGILYRQMKLASKLSEMTDDEKIKLLSTDGMLIKRPLFITSNNNVNRIYIGFKEKEWEEICRN